MTLHYIITFHYNTSTLIDYMTEWKNLYYNYHYILTLHNNVEGKSFHHYFTLSSGVAEDRRDLSEKEPANQDRLPDVWRAAVCRQCRSLAQQDSQPAEKLIQGDLTTKIL